MVLNLYPVCTEKIIMPVYQKVMCGQLCVHKYVFLEQNESVSEKSLFIAVIAVHVVSILCINIMSKLRSSPGFYVTMLLRFLSIAQSTLTEQNVTYIYLINASLQLSSFLQHIHYDTQQHTPLSQILLLSFSSRQ